MVAVVVQLTVLLLISNSVTSVTTAPQIVSETP